jgi:hypothetical protein
VVVFGGVMVVVMMVVFVGVGVCSKIATGRGATDFDCVAAYCTS